MNTVTVIGGFQSFFQKGCDVLVEPPHFVQESRIAGFAIIQQGKGMEEAAFRLIITEGFLCGF